MSNLLKNLLIALGLAVVLFVGYIVFVRNGSDDAGAALGVTGSYSPEAEIETQSLLATLNELKTYNVEGGIFSDPLFLSLKDFRVSLGSEPSGRLNPFAPVR